ncbi:MAG: S41 family peptidase [Rhodospirillaceae bacterium]|nr:S41 family peptidase [Rhodospirillaceae bacterium]
MRVNVLATAAVALSLGVFGALGGTALPVYAADAKSTAKFSDDTYKYLELFGDVFERVRKDYVEDVSDQQLLENAINGMLTALDPHSGYMPAKGFQDMQEQTKGEFGGLGIEVTMEGGIVKVVSPIDDTPASKAGVQPGDFIIAIDGKPAIGLTLSDAVDKMRGPVNSSITVTIRRAGVDPFDIKLTRAVIRVQSVTSRAEGEMGYIRISSFTEQTQTGLENAIKSLKTKIGPEKIKGYVVDLRNNPGGLLDQAVSVSDTFLDRGEIVSTRSRRADETQRYNAKPGDLTDGKPLVVIINDGSASASEIVAGALQDHHRAILLGTKSFGKGSVQTIIPLARGESAMRLTTARYYTPSGRSIQAKGVEPDIEVQPAKIETLAPQGFRRAEGDLPGALKNPDNKDEPKKEEPAKPIVPGTPGAMAPAPGTPGTPAAPTAAAKDAKAAAEEDYQLRRALDLLQGIALYQQASLK